MGCTRAAAVAGRFYPDDRATCEGMAGDLLAGAPRGEALGTIVPHAGWIYSGSTAALGLAGVAASEPQTLVVFGAVHGRTRNEACLFAEGFWQTPLGCLAVDEELAQRTAGCPHVSIDPGAHSSEHSIEVGLPIIQSLLPAAMILPIMVSPGPWAEEVGRACARAAMEIGRKAVFVGSTDLTHYGPAFGFEPHGHGEEGIRWAKEVNDRRLIGLIERMDAKEIVPEASIHRNACGAGAVAATIAAMLEMGATRYQELRHTTSAEYDAGQGGRPVNSVGYEAGVFRR